jgi:GxxExxY protein
MAADEAPIAADYRRERMDRLTRVIIGAAQRVSSVLGYGFLEKVYENALRVELLRRGQTVQQQFPLQVRYESEVVGDYVADLIVGNEVVVELKAVTALDHVHHVQCVHYLRATGMQVCLLLNFGRRALEVRRIVNKF